MADLTYPAALLAANWDKQKGVAAKPSGIGDGLKQLKKLYDAADASVLDTTKPKTLAEVEERLALLDGDFKRKVKSLCDQAKTLATIAKKWEGEYKKSTQNPKEASAADRKSVV